jgi:hypothetical protein
MCRLLVALVGAAVSSMVVMRGSRPRKAAFG